MALWIEVILLLGFQSVGRSYGCGTTYTDASGTFSSPRSGGVYLNSASCTWTIQAGSDCVVRLYSGSFVLEGCCDWVTISSTGSGSLGSYQSTSLAGVPKYGWGTTTVTFTSDGSVTYYGFDFDFNVYCQPDVDECSFGLHSCNSYATCTDTLGSYICTCNDGFEGNGFTCTDIDECVLNTHDCDAVATCSNAVGSHFCTCNTGYSGSGFTCEDEDECVAGQHNCHLDGTCINIPGSFTCTCNTGYTGDGVIVCKVMYEVETDQRYRSSISMKDIQDGDNSTCNTLRRQYFPYFTYKVDVSTYPLELTTTFYIRVVHGNVDEFNVNEWLNVLVTTSGLRDLENPTSSTETLMTCPPHSVTQVYVIVTCQCSQPCSVLLDFVFHTLYELRLCEIELMKAIT